MNYQPQRITAPDGTALIIIRESDYLNLIDKSDIAAADRAAAESDFAMPGEVMREIIAGKTPVKVWREHRGMTQMALAGAAGIMQPSLARVEAGTSTPRPATLGKLAAALDVPVWALTLASAAA